MNCETDWRIALLACRAFSSRPVCLRSADTRLHLVGGPRRAHGDSCVSASWLHGAGGDACRRLLRAPRPHACPCLGPPSATVLAAPPRPLRFGRSKGPCRSTTTEASSLTGTSCGSESPGLALGGRPTDYTLWAVAFGATAIPSARHSSGLAFRLSWHVRHAGQSEVPGRPPGCQCRVCL